MEATTVSNRMISLVVLYDLHTTLFYKAIVNISDEDAHSRLQTKANHIAWITGSLVHKRFEMAKQMGIEAPQSPGDLFQNYRGIQEGVTYPSLEAYKKDWAAISPALRAGLVNLTDERLNEPFEMPGMKMKVYDLIAFTIYREASCIGQIALWRRLLGYDALKYD